MIEVTFENEKSPLERLQNIIATKGKVSAMECLEQIEDLEEDMAGVVISRLSKQWEKIDLSDMPCYEQNEQTMQRQRLEEALIKSGQLMTGLEENDMLRLFLEEVEALSATGDVETLLTQYKNGDEELAEKITNLSLNRVVEMACGMLGHGLLVEDLIQEGSMGLWRAVRKYTGGDYEAHIRHWIGRYMVSALLFQAHTDGVLDKTRRGLADYRDADQRLLMELGRNPTLEEIAEAIHVSPEEAATYAAMLTQARAKEQLEQFRQPKETTPDDEQAVENTAYFQTRQRIAEMLSVLTEQEAKLLTLRFGLEGGLPKTPEQVGSLMGLSPEEVVTIEGNALLKLRQQAQ